MTDHKTYETLWLPNDWLDEVTPAPLRSPDDFLWKCDDGTYVITPKCDPDDLKPEGDEEDRKYYTKPVKGGDTVWFCPSEFYGIFPLHVNEDGTHRIDGDYPAKANCFYLGEHDEVGDSVEDLLLRGGEDGDSALLPGEYSIQIYWWDKDVAFRLDVNQ